MTRGAVLDHAVINVGGGLDAAADTYRRLGFQLTERGHHTLGSSNHLAMFKDNYLELLGYEAQATSVARDLLAGPPGLSGLAFKSDDGEATYRALTERGVPAQRPESFSRPVALPDGMSDARFDVVRLQPKTAPVGNIFFCRHVTPHAVWRSEWQEHPNGAVAIAYLLVAAADPAKTAKSFRILLDFDAPAAVDGSLELDLGTARLIVSSPDGVRRRFPSVMVDDGVDRLMAVGIRVGAMKLAEAAVSRSGVQVERRLTDSIVVGPADTFGVVLEFLS